MQSSTVNLLNSGRHDPQLAVARKLAAIVGEGLAPSRLTVRVALIIAIYSRTGSILSVEVAPARTIEEEVRANP